MRIPMKLRALKLAEELCKVVDRDGMYVAMLPSGEGAFRFDYRFNGHRETLTHGTHEPAGSHCPRCARYGTARGHVQCRGTN